MAYRVTGEQVKQIFETNLSNSAIEPFIRSANVLINSSEDMLELSSDLLFEIELWLSAHFASAYDQRISYQSIGDSKFSFQGEYGKSFMSTDYGQRAVALDSTGTLQDLALGLQRASIDIYEVDYPTTYATVEL